MAKDFDSLMAKMGVTPMGDDKSSSGNTQPSASARVKTVTRKAGESKALGAGPRNEALQRSLMVAKEERAAAEAKVTVLKKKVRRLKTENSGLEERLDTPRATVAQTLAEWGLKRQKNGVRCFGPMAGLNESLLIQVFMKIRACGLRLNRL